MSNTYNYQHFTPSEYDFSKFAGPKAGEPAIDFRATTLDGKEVKLSDFFGKWIVLELGSITCPISKSKVDPMEHLTQQFPDVTFLVLYVREAHPGEKIPQHHSLKEKISKAKLFREKYGVKHTILVDDLAGITHQKYGSMPNSVYIINPSGVIVFRGDWNDVGVVRKILEEQDPNKLNTKERFSGRPYFGSGNPPVALSLAGKTSIWDFIKAFPKMFLNTLQNRETVIRDKLTFVKKIMSG